MRLSTRDHALLTARALHLSLDDHPGLLCTPIALMEIYGVTLWGVLVTLPDQRTLTYTLTQLDNGASGIQDDPLVEIRQALGESIQKRPLPRDRPGKYFYDIISLDSFDEEPSR